jgi:hypothetical protein
MKRRSTMLTVLMLLGWLMPLHFEQFTFAQNKKQPQMPTRTTSDWGPESAGLRCRVTAPNETEQSMPLDVSVQMQVVPKCLKPNVKQLNAFLPAEHMELTMTNVKTGISYRVRPYDPTSGMIALDTGTTVAPLDRTPIKPWEIRFPLVTVGAVLEPGPYDCRVRFSFPQQRTNWWHLKDAAWVAAGFWHGSVESGAFRLEVKKVTPKKRTVLLPKQLRLEKGLKINYTKEDAEPVELTLRNGYFVSAKYYHYNQDKKLASLTMTSIPTPGDVNPISSWSNYKGGDRTSSITIEIFETADPPVHLWHPGPGSGGYKVLWSRTYTLSLTEKEIRAKQ